MFIQRNYFGNLYIREMPYVRKSRSTTRKPAAKARSTRKDSAKSRTPSKPRTRTTGKAKQSSTAIQQTSYTSKTVSLGKQMSRLAMESKLTRTALESAIFRWNAVKTFDTRGYYYMSNKTSGISGYHDLPLFLMDLTSNFQGAITTSNRGPLVSLGVKDTNGDMVFQTRECEGPDGTTNTDTWSVEKSDRNIESGLSGNDKGVGAQAMLEWASIKMNLWGAKSKATKYNISLVQFLDPELAPYHGPSPNSYAVDESNAKSSKRNLFFQNLIKPWTFNPLSTTLGLKAKGMKILQSHNVDIAPNSTTDGDQDPQCRVFKLFVKMNKMINYEGNFNPLNNVANVIDQADYRITKGTQVWNQIQEQKKRIYLMIRATNYARTLLNRTS